MLARHRVTLALPAALWVVTLATAATGGVAYQGSDYSDGTYNNTQVFVCDQEADGRGVHTDSYDTSGNYYRADDTNGSAWGCAYTAKMVAINKHRTVEEINNWPDAIGDWDYNH